MHAKKEERVCSVIRLDIISDKEFPSSHLDCLESEAIRCAQERNAKRKNASADIFIVKFGDEVVYEPTLDEIEDVSMNLESGWR